MKVLGQIIKVLGQKMRVLGQKMGIWDGTENKIFWLENEIFWLRIEIFGMENEVNNQHMKKGIVELKIFVKVMGQKMTFLGQKKEVLRIENKFKKKMMK